jgi:hypothetical protein
MTATSSPSTRTAPAAVTPTLGPLARVVVVAAPVLLLASELLAPRETSDLSAEEDLAFLLAHESRLAASWVLGLVVAGLLAAAYVLLVSRIRGRGSVVGRVAGVLGVAGAVGLAGHYAISLAMLDLAQAGASASLVAGLEDATSAFLTVLPVIVGANLGIILLAVAVVRAGWAPRWVIAAGVLALVADFAPTTYNTVLHAVLAIAVFAAAAVGARTAPTAELPGR